MNFDINDNGNLNEMDISELQHFINDCFEKSNKAYRQFIIVAFVICLSTFFSHKIFSMGFEDNVFWLFFCIKIIFFIVITKKAIAYIPPIGILWRIKHSDSPALIIVNFLLLAPVYWILCGILFLFFAYYKESFIFSFKFDLELAFIAIFYLILKVFLNNSVGQCVNRIALKMKNSDQSYLAELKVDFIAPIICLDHQSRELKNIGNFTIYHIDTENNRLKNRYARFHNQIKEKSISLLSNDIVLNGYATYILRFDNLKNNFKKIDTIIVKNDLFEAKVKFSILENKDPAKCGEMSKNDIEAYMYHFLTPICENKLNQNINELSLHIINKLMNPHEDRFKKNITEMYSSCEIIEQLVNELIEKNLINDSNIEHPEKINPYMEIYLIFKKHFYLVESRIMRPEPDNFIIDDRSNLSEQFAEKWKKIVSHNDAEVINEFVKNDTLKEWVRNNTKWAYLISLSGCVEHIEFTEIFREKIMREREHLERKQLAAKALIEKIDAEIGSQYKIIMEQKIAEDQGYSKADRYALSERVLKTFLESPASRNIDMNMFIENIIKTLSNENEKEKEMNNQLLARLEKNTDSTEKNSETQTL
ncbi:hypothetical protein LJC22_02335 [Desulfosarcina sp. OttesenSCG-928-G10]|nr:hypothetical protein [Desulfosarcina sp. OttesenSCG-928-G10]